MRETALECRDTQPDQLEDDIFNALPRINNWIPALSNLQFHAPNINSIDEFDIDPQLSTARTTRKRKVINFFSIKNFAM